jgi:hypothetical protein
MSQELTSHLCMELDRVNALTNKWIESRIDWIDCSDANFKQNIEEMACTIAALKENERQLENIRPHHDSIKSRQRKEIEEIHSCIKQDVNYKIELDQKLQTLNNEEKNLREELKSLTAEYEETSLKVDLSINELTEGIRNYMNLGLEFQKSVGESMKFIFTQIDPSDPNHSFYFLMYVDSNDKYNIIETNPHLDLAYCNYHVEKLNHDNNIGNFVFKMREAFRNIYVNK